MTTATPAPDSTEQNSTVEQTIDAFVAKADQLRRTYPRMTEKTIVEVMQMVLNQQLQTKGLMLQSRQLDLQEQAQGSFPGFPLQSIEGGVKDPLPEPNEVITGTEETN